MDVRSWKFVRLFTVIASLGLVAGCQTTTPLTWKLPEGVKTIEVNGYPMAYVEKGAGPTVILVHGAMCDYRCWGPSMQALAHRYRVVSVSMRHYYPQDWDGSGNTYSMAQHSKDLASFAEKMSPPVRIVAHSYGGAVAFWMARDRPELLVRLVLAEASTYGLLPAPTAQQLDERKKWAEFTENVMRTKGAGAAMEFGVDSLYGKGTWARYPAWLQDVHRDNAWTLIAGAKEPPPMPGTEAGRCADFGSLKMPVLLVTGENTAPRFKQILAEQGRCLPSAKTLVIPNVGHAMIGQPAFVTAVTDFLK